MKEVTLEVDGKVVRVREGKSLLEAAREAGIEIPTLCWEEGLDPYGGCRICSVEIEREGRKRIVASCAYPAEEGLKVRTQTQELRFLRKSLLELVFLTGLPLKEGSKFWKLVKEYGADPLRFTGRVGKKEEQCILCGLCVRTCFSVTQDGVLTFVGRGVNRSVALFPEKTAYCKVCGYCSRVCPTGKIPPEGPMGVFPSAYEVGHSSKSSI
ncbi:MAG: (2Fe-2S)-binding protein [Hadesarchaea archaeon]|nr:MAG: (2Fe-2S)-binding protein [Hadesarchaea archaeon]